MHQLPQLFLGRPVLPARHIQPGQDLAQPGGLRHAPDRRAQQVDGACGEPRLAIHACQRRYGVHVRGCELHRALGIGQGPRSVLHPQARHGTHREEFRVVRMLREHWLDQFQCLVRSPGKEVQPREAGARGHVIGVEVDCRLVHGSRAAGITESLRNASQEVVRFGILRCDLQGIGELHARLLELAVRQVLLAARDVARAAGLRPPAPTHGTDDPKQRSGDQDRHGPVGRKHPNVLCHRGREETGILARAP